MSSESDAEPIAEAACSAVRYTQPRGPMTALLVTSGLLGFVGTAIALASVWTVGPIMLLGLLPGLATAVAHRWLRSREARGAGTVRADAQALQIETAGGRESIDAAQLAWGAAHGNTVEFETTGGRRLVASTATAAEASRLLQASGMGVDRRTVTVPLRGLVGPFVRGLLLWFALLTPLGLLAVGAGAAVGVPTAGLLGGWLTPLVSFFLARYLVREVLSPALSIGIDGVTIRRGLRPRFIPHERIERVEHVGPTVTVPGGVHVPESLRLHLHGEVVDLPIIGWTADDVQRVAQRLAQAREAAGRAAGAPAAAFARGGRDVAAWRTHLRRLVSADPGFRRRGATAEDAEAVLADPGAPLEQRLGAALALKQIDPERARVRIRIAADAAAEEPTRIALEVPLRDDPGAEERLLEALAEQEALQARRERAPR